jgi:hypothetical protein
MKLTKVHGFELGSVRFGPDNVENVATWFEVAVNRDLTLISTVDDKP